MWLRNVCMKYTQLHQIHFFGFSQDGKLEFEVQEEALSLALWNLFITGSRTGVRLVIRTKQLKRQTH